MYKLLFILSACVLFSGCAKHQKAETDQDKVIQCDFNQANFSRVTKLDNQVDE